MWNVQVSVSICLCTAVLHVYVWLAWLINRQWVGEVEGVHRLRLLTQSWQNASSGAPRNLAGPAQRCNPIPSIQHTAPETQWNGLRALSILIPLLVTFSSFCVTIGFRGFFRPICLPVSLSVSYCLALTHSLSLCLKTACSEMLRPWASLKVWGLGLEVLEDGQDVLFTEAFVHLAAKPTLFVLNIKFVVHVEFLCCSCHRRHSWPRGAELCSPLMTEWTLDFHPLLTFNLLNVLLSDGGPVLSDDRSIGPHMNCIHA